VGGGEIGAVGFALAGVVGAAVDGVDGFSGADIAGDVGEVPPGGVGVEQATAESAAAAKTAERTIRDMTARYHRPSQRA
jgi:hypothetical protein